MDIKDILLLLRPGALTAPNPATFFEGGAAGYTDYPALTPTERDAA